MDVEKLITRLNVNREDVECGFVMGLWKDPFLYQEYGNLNERDNKTLITEDAIFYYKLGQAMYKAGYRTFDSMAIDLFINDKPRIKQQFEERGGLGQINDILKLTSTKNVEACYDTILKNNMLISMAFKTNELFENTDSFLDCTSEDVYNIFENLNNSLAIQTNHNENITDLVINQSFIDSLSDGTNIGFNYGRWAPMLNYITLGCAPRSLYMLAGHSGSGKTSFVFGVIIMGLVASGNTVAIISNEMGIDTYKTLLLEHILTKDLEYWGLTRKSISIGNFTDEQKEMLKKAAAISEEKYSCIKFVKMFDNNISKVNKYLKKLKSNDDVSVVLYDTYKSDDSVDVGALWQSLMLDTRKLFQTCDKLGICVITTYQLALHTINQRYLDASCLSNAKQVKEVYETMVYCRPLWEDEYPGEKHDVHPYRINRDNPKIKDSVELDKDKKYLLFFVDKTRADDDKQILIYEFNSRFNHWVEKGYARVVNEHRNN